MDKAFWDRWSPASGIVFIVLAIVGLLVIGEFPAADDPAEEFSSFFIDDRGRIVAGAIIWTFSFAFFLWFAASVAARVREAGERRLSAAVLAGGAVFAGMGLVAIAIMAGVARPVAEEVDPEVVKGLSALGSAVDITTVLPFAVLVFASGIAALRTGLLPPWFGYASLAAAPILALVATTWAGREGFWAPYGGFYMIGIVVFLVWVLVASALLIARPPASGEPLTSVPQAGREGPSPPA